MSEREGAILQYLASRPGQQRGTAAHFIRRATGLQGVGATLAAMQKKKWVWGLASSGRWAEGDPLWWRITEAGLAALIAGRCR